MAKFFPKSQYPITVCKHRFGKDVTITEQTDTIQQAPRYAVEYYGFKHNVRAGAFLGKHYPEDSIDISTIEKQGNIRCDIYLYIGGVGANALDYDGAMAIITPWFYGLTGRRHSAVSFAFGEQWMADYTINDFLVARNSEIGESQYENYTRIGYANTASTIRWYDFPLTWAEVGDALASVIASGGWFRNFTHWHNLSSTGVLYKQGEFYATLQNKLTELSKTAHFCSWGEAGEYMVYRDLITRTACYKSVNGKLRIAIEADNLFLQDNLNTPISVKIDLAGTEFAGKDFTSNNCDIIKLSANEFIINVPFRVDAPTNKVMLVELEETVTPDYRVFTRPTGTATQSGASLNVVTNRPCRMVVFQKGIALAEEKYTLKERQLVLKSNHTFNGFDFSSASYSVGIIDKWGNQNILFA